MEEVEPEKTVRNSGGRVKWTLQKAKGFQDEGFWS
jgi:hypothetical protein